MCLCLVPTPPPKPTTIPVLTTLPATASSNNITQRNDGENNSKLKLFVMTADWAGLILKWDSARDDNAENQRLFNSDFISKSC